VHRKGSSEGRFGLQYTCNAGSSVHKSRDTAKKIFCLILNVVKTNSGGCLLPRKIGKFKEHIKFNIPYHKFKNASGTSGLSKLNN
jgi:hypothetical protein